MEAINAQVSVLESKAADSERLMALKWVIHLIGDVHQPLHAGLKADKGATSTKFKLLVAGPAFMRSGTEY